MACSERDPQGEVLKADDNGDYALDRSCDQS
jgi:hypothetical protein